MAGSAGLEFVFLTLELANGILVQIVAPERFWSQPSMMREASPAFARVGQPRFWPRAPSALMPPSSFAASDCSGIESFAAAVYFRRLALARNSGLGGSALAGLALRLGLISTKKSVSLMLARRGFEKTWPVGYISVFGPSDLLLAT